MEYSNISSIEIDQIHAYRGSGFGTTVYMKNGDVKYLREEFDQADKIIVKHRLTPLKN